ncbi:hypothetical protein LX32DRAFT_603670, partial [Colletotrichum zoysiae]
PPDVVGLAAVDDLVTGPVVVVVVVVEEAEEYCPRLLVEALGGYRVRVSPGSLVEGVLVRPARALVFDGGGADGGPEPTGPSAAASFWRVGADGGFRRKSVDIGFVLVFFGAASALAVALATLAPETLRVVGRRAASDRGAGSLLGEPGRWAEAAVVDAVVAAAAEEERAAVPVAVGGRSVEEPCVGFRSERVRARDEDMMVVAITRIARRRFSHPPSGPIEYAGPLRVCGRYVGRAGVGKKQEQKLKARFAEA